MEGRYTADMIARDLRNKDVKKEVMDNVHFIADGVQTSFREKRLQPMLRAFYNRTAFQLPGDQRLRISLDTDLTFIREDGLDGQNRRANNNWRRKDVDIDYPFNYVSPGDILRFPYAVLETKLQTHLGQEPPAWLTSLVESHLVHEVPRFSKYLHGACHFYRERLPLLPWWLAELNTDIRKPRAEHIGLTRSRSFKPLIDGQYRRAMIEATERANQHAVVTGSNTQSNSTTVITPASSQQPRKSDDNPAWRPYENHPKDRQDLPPTPLDKRITMPPQLNKLLDNKWVTRVRDGISGTPPPPAPPPKTTSDYGTPVDEESGLVQQSISKRQRVKVRVEPKVFFANERTFISWLQFCALMLTVALSLLNFGDQVSRTIGGIFIALAAAVAIYALYRFEKRAWYVLSMDTSRCRLTPT